MFKGEDEEHEGEGEQEDSDDDVVAFEIKNPAVSRLDKLTKTEKNRKLLKRKRREEEDVLKSKKTQEKEFGRIPSIIGTLKKEAKENKAFLEQLEKERKEELLLQKKSGIINNASRIGRYKYKMRKTDFQPEEDLSGNLRTIKPIGADNMLEERFDSIFRRNLLAPDAKEGDDKKRVRKAKYKFHLSKSEKDKTTRLKEKNDKRKKANEEMGQGRVGLLKNDLILI